MSSGDDAVLVMNSDQELIQRVRQGDREAYAALWKHHSNAAISVAKVFTSSLEPEDLVSEAYTVVLEALQNGGGPTGGAFRPYLYTVIRNLARRWGSSRREIAVDELPETPSEDDIPRDQIGALDRGMVGAAFGALPQRWQEVLWYTEVESMTPAQTAPLLGLSANGVSALAYRAREGLRQAWLQAHVADAQHEGECAWAMARLGEHSRDGLGRRDAARMDSHLATCRDCRDVGMEVNQVSGQLALYLAPLILGGAPAAAWLSSLGTGTAAASAAGTAALGFLGGAGFLSGPLGIITAVAVAGSLTVAGVSVSESIAAESTGATTSSSAEANAAGTTGGDAEGSIAGALDPAVPGADGSDSPITSPALSGLSGLLDPLLGNVVAALPVVSTLTDGLSDTLNQTTDGVTGLVENVTGGAVKADVHVDLTLTNPQVQVQADVIQGAVTADVNVGGESILDLNLGILGIDLGVTLGGPGGLLGIKLFGK